MICMMKPLYTAQKIGNKVEAALDRWLLFITGDENLSIHKGFF